MHRPNVFYHSEKCDAEEEKSYHQLFFMHLAELQEAEPIRFGT